ncbi:MAG: hypothetical protein ACJ72L_21775 [Marmoricola sp.]
MNMREWLSRPPSTFEQASWLFATPVVAALVLLLVVAPNLPYDAQSDLPKRGPFVVASSIPMLAALGAFGYGLTMRNLRPLFYLLPFGLLSLVSVVSGVLLAAKNQDPDLVPKGSLVDVAAAITAACWLLLPCAAIVGGLLAFVAVQRRG